MLDVAHLFPGAAECIYLNTASQALGNQPAVDALTTAIDEWRRGRFSWVDAETRGEELRAMAARVLGARTEDVALTASAAGGAATVAAQLGPATPGANIVVPEQDYMSNFVPWYLLGELGYELRTVPDVAGALPVDAFAPLVDADTAVIATSLVQSFSGYRVDLDGLKALAATNNAWLVIDASQAFGAVGMDLEGIAALFSCSHKWTLGTRGIGYLYVTPDLRDDFRPVLPGWKAVADRMAHFYGPEVEIVDTAAKLDVSWPWFNPLADLAGLEIIEDIGVAAIEAHNRALVETLAEGGAAIAYRPHERSAIVSLPVTDPETAIATMEAQNMIASLRAGRLRVSFHLYNTLDDVEQILRVVGDA